MPVAVKNATETFSRPALNRLAVGSLLGTAYVLVSLALVFYVIPTPWSAIVSPALAGVSAIDKTLLILVMLAAAAGLAYGGVRFVGPAPMHGQKAGIAVGLAMLLGIGLVTEWVGSICERLIYNTHMFASSGVTVGVVVTALVGVALLVLCIQLFFRPGFERWLRILEDQGWFSLASYKKSQGQRVRRGTILAILILAGCGVFTLLAHHTLDTGPDDWGISLPFTGKVTVTDPGDAAALANSPLASDHVRIIDPGKSGLPPYAIVPRQEFEAERGRLEKAGQKAPVGGPVVDRFALRDLNDQLRAGYERITDPGKSNLKKGEVVPRDKFVSEKKRLEAENKPAPKEESPRPAAGSVEYQRLRLLPHIRFTLPILLTVFSLWFAYRLVNFPPFADFLIATEAELNKVSWTTRKRLVQDTIVVLVTMLLLTVFLFTVDVFWGRLLSWKYIGVIQIPDSVVDTRLVDGQIAEKEAELSAAEENKNSEQASKVREELGQLKKHRERLIKEKPEDRLDW